MHITCIAISTCSLIHLPARDTERDRDCKDRDLRLENGSSVREGRVEVCFNNAWGTICNQGYGVTAAEVFCAQMEFQGEKIFLWHSYSLCIDLPKYVRCMPEYVRCMPDFHNTYVIIMQQANVLCIIIRVSIN